MVHVCFVSPKIHNYLDAGEPSNAGGAERQQYLLGQALLDRGHEVSLLTRNFDDGLHRIQSDGFDVWKKIPDVRGIRNAPVKALRVLNALRRLRADVYYVRGNDFLCMVTSMYCRISKGSFVYAVSSDADIEPQHLTEYHPLRRRAFVDAVRNADAVVSQTEYQHDVLADAYDIDSAIIGNGYQVPDEDDIVPHGERTQALWVGRMDSEQKRPGRFFELARALPGHEFSIVGPPNDDEKEYFEKLQAEAGDIPNLQFEGFVSPDRIDDYFRRAGVLVNTSDYEGLPNVFLEAWRYATPVISLHYTLDGALPDDDIGIHSGTMEALRDDTERLLNDVDTRTHLGWRGREYLIENYSIRAIVDQYERLFYRVSRSDSSAVSE